MTRPYPCCFMIGNAVCIAHKGPRNPTASPCSMSSSVLSSTRLILPPPHALFTRMSTVPHASTAAAIIASLSPLRRTSVRTKRVSLPVSDMISSAVARPRAGSSSAITTRAPSVAKPARDASTDAVTAPRDHRHPVVEPSHCVPLGQPVG